jgi:hypothetical protein
MKQFNYAEYKPGMKIVNRQGHEFFIIGCKKGGIQRLVVESTHGSTLSYYEDGCYNYDKKEGDFDLFFAPTASDRPWYDSEVPIGALIRPYSDNDKRAVIIYIQCYTHSLAASGSFITYQEAYASYEYSTDNGKIWLPCKVKDFLHAEG